MISPSSTNPDVTKVGDYIFRICFIDPFQGYIMAKFAKDELKLTNVAVLRDPSQDYSVGLADAFIKEFTAMGGKIATDVSYKASDSDFRSQLGQVKNANADGVFIPGYYGEVGTIARQAREIGIKAPLMGGDGWDSSELVKGAGGAGGSTTFTRATKATAQIRKWSINGISLHTAKGAASQAASWIQLATISGTSITQHVVGMISITPPAITFIIA